jgi:hypothetical protein
LAQIQYFRFTQCLGVGQKCQPQNDVESVVQIALYHRREDGGLEYRGVERWNTLAECLRYYACDTRHPQVQYLKGWSHTSVTWYGDLGIGANVGPF